MLFITYDLRVASKICDRVVVMNQGVVVETGYTNQVFQNPQHEYTKILIQSIPGQDWNPVVTQQWWLSSNGYQET